MWTLANQCKSPKWPNRSNRVKPSILDDTGKAELNIRNIAQFNMMVLIEVCLYLGSILLKNGKL